MLSVHIDLTLHSKNQSGNQYQDYSIKNLLKLIILIKTQNCYYTIHRSSNMYNHEPVLSDTATSARYR